MAKEMRTPNNRLRELGLDQALYIHRWPQFQLYYCMGDKMFMDLKRESGLSQKVSEPTRNRREISLFLPFPKKFPELGTPLAKYPD